MNTTNNNTMACWRESLAQLPWTPQDAEHSAKLALSKAEWLGINKELAIGAVFEAALDGFFEENPHIPLELWITVSEHNACPDEFALLAA